MKPVTGFILQVTYGALILEPSRGIEPRTYALRVRCSTD